MGVQVILEFVLVATLVEPSCLLAELQYFTLKDKYLPGQVYKALHAPDWSECLQVCAMSEGCVSYSFEKRKRSENCYLHACGFLNKCVAMDSVIASQGSVFQQLRPITVCINVSDPLLFTRCRYSLHVR